ncbi:hypothetical protein V6N12_004809 [Hibiscus sabdariffa]|uniref:Uncharacterized protein n=1 Tax=Hibiscus sabdariffa TaxID=183260 RepID=A0ABR2CMN0_9ROSI
MSELAVLMAERICTRSTSTMSDLPRTHKSSFLSWTVKCGIAMRLGKATYGVFHHQPGSLTNASLCSNYPMGDISVQQNGSFQNFKAPLLSPSDEASSGVKCDIKLLLVRKREKGQKVDCPLCHIPRVPSFLLVTIHDPDIRVCVCKHPAEFS